MVNTGANSTKKAKKHGPKSKALQHIRRYRKRSQTSDNPVLAWQIVKSAKKELLNEIERGVHASDAAATALSQKHDADTALKKLEYSKGQFVVIKKKVAELCSSIKSANKADMLLCSRETFFVPRPISSNASELVTTKAALERSAHQPSLTITKKAKKQ